MEKKSHCLLQNFPRILHRNFLLIYSLVDFSNCHSNFWWSIEWKLLAPQDSNSHFFLSVLFYLLICIYISSLENSWLCFMFIFLPFPVWILFFFKYGVHQFMFDSNTASIYFLLTFAFFCHSFFVCLFFQDRVSL